MQLAWENSPHFATPPVVCPRNDVWENSAEIPYWWRALARSEISFWLVANLLHLIGSSTQISVHNGISALVSQTSFRGETTGSVVKCRLFSHATMQQVSWNCVKYYAIFYKENTSFFFLPVTVPASSFAYFVYGVFPGLLGQRILATWTWQTAGKQTRSIHVTQNAYL